MASDEPEIPPHGTRRRYVGSRTRKPCRCEECTRANRDYARARRGTDPDRGDRPSRPSPGNDGSCPLGDGVDCEVACRSQYVRGCRGEACASENRLYQRSYMAWWRHGVRRGEWSI